MGNPIKLEKAMLRKMPGGGGGGALADAAGIAAGAAASAAGIDGMLPTVWTDTEMHFKFNPTELRESQSMRVTTRPVSGSQTGPQSQSTGSEGRTLDFTVFLDEWEALAGEDVSAMVAKLRKWTEPERASGSGPNQPPVAMFVWGRFTFRGFVKSVNATYTLFRRDGTPARANVAVSMIELREAPAGTNPTSGGPPGRHSHRVVLGDSLHSIAYREYGDPAYWRAIAAANGIDDPLDLRVGTSLLVPAADDARAWR